MFKEHVFGFDRDRFSAEMAIEVAKCKTGTGKVSAVSYTSFSGT